MIQIQLRRTLSLHDALNMFVVCMPIAVSIASYDARQACPQYQSMGCILDALEKSCGHGDDSGSLDIIKYYTHESVWMCCCPLPYKACLEADRSLLCNAALTRHIKPLQHRSNTSLREVRRGLELARGDLHASGGEACRVLASPHPISGCGHDASPRVDRSLARQDLFCEMLTWQREELGDGNEGEFQRNDCPWPAVVGADAHRKGGRLPVLEDYATHKVTCETTAGEFTIALVEPWSPHGVKRFVELIEARFFNDQLLYYVVPGMLIQFGVASRPDIQASWDNFTIPDEPRMVKFRHGTVSFSAHKPHSRSCQMAIAVDPYGVEVSRVPYATPIGQVVEGMEVLDAIQQHRDETKYGNLSQLYANLTMRGNMAAAAYPDLDRISDCKLQVMPGKTLNESVFQILSGKYANNFYSGDETLLGRPSNQVEEVGFCLLDKAYAILFEDAIDNFPHEFLFDLSACCTKPDAYRSCIRDLSPVYAFLVNAVRSTSGGRSLIAAAMARLLISIRPLLSGAEVAPKGAFILGLCSYCSESECSSFEWVCQQSNASVIKTPIININQTPRVWSTRGMLLLTILSMFRLSLLWLN